MSFLLFKHMLSGYLATKFYTFSLIGVANIATSTPSLINLGLPIVLLAPPPTHQQNSVVEGKHRHLVETGLTLLAHASVPFCYWSDAFSTACFLINRLPTGVLDMKSPIEKLFNETPDYTFFKVFGCACWPHLRPYNNHKLEFHSKQCVFLSYSSLQKEIQMCSCGFKTGVYISGRCV